jgi:hypothetical protein
VQPVVERLINMFRILQRCALDVLPAKELAAILETSLRITSVFDTLKTFDTGSIGAADDPSSAVQVQEQLDAVAQAAYQTLGLIVAKTFCLGDYFNGQLDGASDHFSRIMSISLEAKSRLSDLQRLVQYEVSSKFSDTFDKEAAKHHKSAWGWTVLSAAFGGVGVGYLIYSFEKLDINMLTAGKLFAVELGHIAAAAFIFFWMYFCARNASSHRNNEILNAQRRNTLRTVGIVAEASPSESFQNEIVAAAARAAYEQQPTTFGSKN